MSPKKKTILRSVKESTLASRVERLEKSDKKFRDVISRLRKNEEIYKKLTMASKEAVIITDLDANIRYVSEHTVNMYGGMHTSDFLGKNLIELIAPEDRAGALESSKRIISEGFISDLEYRFLKFNGKRFPGDISATLIRNRMDKPVAIMYALRDLTRTKMTENVLKITEDKYRMVFNNANDAIVLYQMDGTPGKFMEVNDVACRMLGYERDALLKLTFNDLIAPDFVKKSSGAEALLRANGGVVFETCIVKADAVMMACEISAHVFIMDSSRAVIAIIRDVTLRKKYQDELEESERMYRSLIDLSPDAVIIVNSEGKIIYASERALEMNGAPGMDLFVGRNVADIVSSEEKQKTLDAIKTMFDSGGLHNMEFVLNRYDGTKMTGDASGSVLRTASGRVKGAIITVRDITEKKKIARELEESYAAVKKIMDGIIKAMEKLVEKKDMYTVGHQHRTAQLAKAIAEKMGLSKEQVSCIYLSSLIHDIGKIFVPGVILNKPGELTANEYEIIKKHPEAGYEVLKTVDFPYPIADIILQHHERLDGSGYPYGLKGDKISIESRILSVADVVEAITFARPYRPAFGVDKALEEIMNKRGTQFDPEVVDVCRKLLKEQNFKFEQV